MLIEAYEHEHFPIADPDPIDFLQHVMEAGDVMNTYFEMQEIEWYGR